MDCKLNPIPPESGQEQVFKFPLAGIDTGGLGEIYFEATLVDNCNGASNSQSLSNRITHELIYDFNLRTEIVDDRSQIRHGYHKKCFVNVQSLLNVTKGLRTIRSPICTTSKSPTLDPVLPRIQPKSKSTFRKPMSQKWLAQFPQENTAPRPSLKSIRLQSVLRLRNTTIPWVIKWLIR